MPFVDLDTNLPQNSLPEDFADKLCEATASILGKPRDRITLTVKTGSTILVGGSSAPCAQMVISSIGVVCSAEQNKEHSAKFFEFLTRELNLEQDRIRLRFIPIEAWQVGVKGTVMSYL